MTSSCYAPTLRRGGPRQRGVSVQGKAEAALLQHPGIESHVSHRMGPWLASRDFTLTSGAAQSPAGPQPCLQRHLALQT
jgi:hypothetical protein